MSNPKGYDGPVEDWDEEIYVAALDGSGVVRVSNRPGNDHWPPSWSADGRCLTWQGDDPNELIAADVIVVALDDGQPINLTGDGANTYTFDAKNRMTAATTPSLTSTTRWRSGGGRVCVFEVPT